jgi:hypothetical protein
MYRTYVDNIFLCFIIVINFSIFVDYELFEVCLSCTGTYVWILYAVLAAFPSLGIRSPQSSSLVYYKEGRRSKRYVVYLG